MLLIRPLLRANLHRERKKRTPSCSSSCWSRTSGARRRRSAIRRCYLGFLRGVPFFWTLQPPSGADDFAQRDRCWRSILRSGIRHCANKSASREPGGLQTMPPAGTEAGTIFPDRRRSSWPCWAQASGSPARSRPRLPQGTRTRGARTPSWHGDHGYGRAGRRLAIGRARGANEFSPGTRSRRWRSSSRRFSSTIVPALAMPKAGLARPLGPGSRSLRCERSPPSGGRSSGRDRHSAVVPRQCADLSRVLRARGRGPCASDRSDAGRS